MVNLVGPKILAPPNVGFSISIYHGLIPLYVIDFRMSCCSTTIQGTYNCIDTRDIRMPYYSHGQDLHSHISLIM